MYPVGELRAAREAARADGVDVPENMHPHDVVRRLERGGYLPRDRARVYALAERARRQASERVRVGREQPQQMVMPWDGRWSPAEPEQMVLL
jgi:hypothetical protein